jgi:uncharacterized membrane protein YgcG
MPQPSYRCGSCSSRSLVGSTKSSATSSTTQEENRALREQLGPGRLRFTDAQRRRLAAKAKTLGRRMLQDIATIVTPDTGPML